MEIMNHPNLVEFDNCLQKLGDGKLDTYPGTDSKEEENIKKLKPAKLRSARSRQHRKPTDQELLHKCRQSHVEDQRRFMNMDDEIRSKSS